MPSPEISQRFSELGPTQSPTNVPTRRPTTEHAVRLIIIVSGISVDQLSFNVTSLVHFRASLGKSLDVLVEQINVVNIVSREKVRRKLQTGYVSKVTATINAYTINQAESVKRNVLAPDYKTRFQRDLQTFSTFASVVVTPKNIGCFWFALKTVLEINQLFDRNRSGNCCEVCQNLKQRNNLQWIMARFRSSILWRKYSSSNEFKSNLTGSVGDSFRWNM